MTSSNQKKELIEIKIDSEDAIDNFGSETFEENILLFVDEGYKNYKNGIKKAQTEHDQATLKMLTHTLKTTSRYMSSENFAQICHGIESETKSPNWEKIDGLLLDFFICLDLLYHECVKFYNDFKPAGEKKNVILVLNGDGDSFNNNKDKSNNYLGNSENNKNNFNNNNNEEEDLQGRKFPADKLEASKSSGDFETTTDNNNNININNDSNNHNFMDKSANNIDSNYKHINFKNCKTFIAEENTSTTNNLIKNENEKETEKITIQQKRENTDNNLLTTAAANPSVYNTRLCTGSSDKMGSFSNSFIKKRNNFLGQNSKSNEFNNENKNMDKDNNHSNNYNTSDNDNNNKKLDFKSFGNVQSTKIMGVSSKNLLYTSADISMEIDSPLPDNSSSKIDKYVKIFNDDSVVCKELDLKAKSGKGGIYASGVSTPKYKTGNYDIATSKTDLTGK